MTLSNKSLQVLFCAVLTLGSLAKTQRAYAYDDGGVTARAICLAAGCENSGSILAACYNAQEDAIEAQNYPRPNIAGTTTDVNVSMQIQSTVQQAHTLMVAGGEGQCGGSGGGG